MHRFDRGFKLLFSALLLFSGMLTAENWPGWRGPGNDGISAPAICRWNGTGNAM